MRNFWKSLCAGTLALGMGATAVVPASALPQTTAPAAVSNSADGQLVQVADRDDLRRLRRANRFERRIDRRETRRFGRDFERRNNGYYYRGYRGYRDARPGYRRYNGYYFPGAAFIAGALITGAIVNNGRPSGSDHVDWCHNRYQSYRASDNTYQPNSGPRRQCNSPFD